MYGSSETAVLKMQAMAITSRTLRHKTFRLGRMDSQDKVTHMYEVDRRAERLKQWGLVEDHTMRWGKKKK